jgi:GAF domain-containing protein
MSQQALSDGEFMTGVAGSDSSLLRLVAAGTAAEVGREFFRQLVRTLAEALDSKYAFVSRFCDNNARVHVLAFWDGQEMVEDFDYPLRGSPCERVVGGKIVAFECGIVQLFPEEREDLEEMGAEAYLAIPLKKPGGQVLGHLAVIATVPKTWQERDFGVLRIFAARATAEMERELAEQEMRAVNRELLRRTQLEALIGSISTEFVSLPVSDVDRTIVQSLGRVSRFGHSESAQVLSISPDGEKLAVTHTWRDSDQPIRSGSLDDTRSDRLTVLLDRVRGNQALLLPSGQVSDQELDGLLQVLQDEGIHSSAVVPMVYGSRPVGAIVLDSSRQEQGWMPQDIRLLRLLGEIVASAMARKRQQEAMAHRLELEGMVAATSTRFVSAPPGRVSEEIDRTLAKIGPFIGSDRGLVYLFDKGKTVATLTNQWIRSLTAAPCCRLTEIRADTTPEVIEHFVGRRAVNASRPEDLPPGFNRLNELPGAERVKSRIAVPIIAGDETRGILCFHSVDQERQWPAEDQRLLGLLAEIIGSALARDATEMALQRAKEVDDADIMWLL